MSENKDTLDIFERKLQEAVEVAASTARNEERLRQSKILARRVSMLESKFEAEFEARKAKLDEEYAKDIQQFLLENIKKVQEATEEATLADIEAELIKVQEGSVHLRHREEEMPFGYEEELYGETGGDMPEGKMDEALEPEYRLQRPTKIKGELMKQRIDALKAAQDEEDEEQRDLPDEILELPSGYDPIKSAAAKGLAMLKSRYGGGRMSYEEYDREDRIRRIEARIRRARVRKALEEKLAEGKESDLVGNAVKSKGGYGPVKEIGDALSWYEKYYKGEGKDVLKKKMKEEAARRAKLREAILQIQSDRKAAMEAAEVTEADAGSIERKFALAGKGEELGDPLKQEKAKRESKLFDETSAEETAKVESKVKAAESEEKSSEATLEGLDKVTKGLSDEAKKAVIEAVKEGKVKSGEDLKAFLTEGLNTPATPVEEPAEVEDSTYGYDIPQNVDC